MKLEPPRRQTARVYELARELGWTSRQLLNELHRRGEFVKSATSVLEPPVVRAIRQEFATGVAVSDLEADVSAAAYGRSAEPSVAGRDDSFASALAEARKRSNTKGTNGFAQWKSPILSVLLEELVAAGRSQHLDDLEGRYFRRKARKAGRLNVRWAEARLNGLVGDDAFIIRWIRLSGGQTPDIATDLACGGITPEEAGLSIGHGGRIDGHLPSIFDRLQQGTIKRSEAIALVRQWRQVQRAV